MKTLKLIVKTLLFGSIFICMFPLAVFAEEEPAPTYALMGNSGCYENSTSSRFFLIAWSGGNDIRGVKIRSSSSRYNFYLMSRNNFQIKTSNNATASIACPVNAESNAQITTQYGETIYYYSLAQGSNSRWNELIDSINAPLHDNTQDGLINSAYYYTFGEGAVDPEEPVEPINWGSVRDPEYSTRIAGRGSTSKQNVDVLRWNKEIDTNGNDISECEIEIQAVPGSWSDSTLQGLLNQAVNAFNSTGVQPVTLDTVSASDGLFNVSWNSIISTLNWNFDYLIARETQSNLWEKYGWYYRIRLLSPDGYEGQWQTLYTPLSSSAQDSETVINHNSFDMSVNQVYQNITQLNNNTSVTIVYNDTDYTVQNPDNGTEPTGGTNLWDILKELLNGIFQILAKLGDLIVGLVDGLFDLFRSLFTPPEVDQTVNNDINLNINNYITESQPGLQDQQLHLHQIFSDLESISSAYSSGGDCVLQWDDVAMDLSVFNAGTVTFIPGGTYDFKAAFMQLLAGFGMTYATYQMLVSGVIYILLFVLISHKVKGFLKKT